MARIFNFVYLIVIFFIFSSVKSAFSSSTDPSSQSNYIPADKTISKKLPIGMNLPAINYYEPFLLFCDVMKTADFRVETEAGWDSDKFSLFPKDNQGYPTEVPYNIDGIDYNYLFLLNSWYSGEYVLLYEGKGIIEIRNAAFSLVNGKYHLTLPGKQENIWIVVKSVVQGNHIRNLRVIPVKYLDRENEMPIFQEETLRTLGPFHSIRFMDSTQTNGSPAVEWSNRTKKDSITQSLSQGISWDYVIALSNQLNSDPWINIPHKASDNYIIQLATLFKNNLKSNLKIYLEFSNELWNWPFSQAGYILNNAPDHPDNYVSADLAAIAAAGESHPEKDAYMMARTFRLFSMVFGDQFNSRVVRVATGQVSWPDNSRRILHYLFKTDGIGADALAVGGYFYFNPKDHEIWKATDPEKVTPAMVLQSAIDYFPSNTATLTRATAVYSRQYDVDYLVYEGGQHMQPYNQEEWGYNHAVYDAQIAPEMYKLYMDNFSLHSETAVNCKLFMAYSFIGKRESPYGSWGHLENLNQLTTPEKLMVIAPKYKALLDINTER